MTNENKAIELLRRELQMVHNDQWKHPENRASVMPMHSVDRFEDCPDCAEREAVKFLVAHDAAPKEDSVSALVEALEYIGAIARQEYALRGRVYNDNEALQSALKSIISRSERAIRQQQPAQETGQA